ncbi:hypothetical protein BDZ97DRAFT_1842177 [Flammula alnicola]|nr:hypothetical protein BDZ97DRAFT_1842177 [Flammula alnicola]
MLRGMFFLIASFLLLVNAQTLTTTNLNGVSIVEIVTTDPLGAPTTQIHTTPTTSVATSASQSSSTTATQSTSSTTTTATAATTTPQGQQGPVGQPAASSGTPGAPTPYAYTTVIGGVTTVIQDTFTPTSPATVSVAVTGSGTILDFSSWASIYGSPTAVAASSGSALRPTSALVLVLSAISCLMGL